MPFDRGRGLDPVRFERVRHSQEFCCSFARVSVWNWMFLILCRYSGDV